MALCRKQERNLSNRALVMTCSMGQNFSCIDQKGGLVEHVELYKQIKILHYMQKRSARDCSAYRLKRDLLTFLDASYFCTQQCMGTWPEAGGDMRQGKELATRPPNAMAKHGTFLTKCFPTLV